MRDSSFFTVIFSGYGDKSPDNRTGCKGDAAIPSIAAIGYNQSMNMHESGEMYLETILRLSKRNPEVHSIDVANEMGFVTPFTTFSDYLPSNPLVQANEEYNEAGKTPVSWNFTTMPSENWKNNVGSALLEYAQGTGDWSGVETAFVDGWATEYAAANE